MKDNNLPNDYNSLSLEELTKEANKMIEDLESQKNLENSVENYQNLIKLNNVIEKKCIGNTQQNLLFSDNHHLSNYASKYVVDEIINLIKK